MLIFRSTTGKISTPSDAANMLFSTEEKWENKLHTGTFFFKIWIFQNKATDAYLIMKINRVRHYLSHDSLYLFPVLFPYSTSLSKEQVMSSHLQWLKNINSSKTCMQSLFSSPLHTAQSTLIKDREGIQVKVPPMLWAAQLGNPSGAQIGAHTCSTITQCQCIFESWTSNRLGQEGKHI